jgi:hypothetical protein
MIDKQRRYPAVDLEAMAYIPVNGRRSVGESRCGVARDAWEDEREE